MQNWEDRIPQILRGLPRISSFANSITGYVVDHMSEQVLSTPSQLITLAPGEHRFPVVTIVSRHVAHHLFRAVLASDATAFWEFYNLFSRVEATRSAAGWLWEPCALKELSSGTNRTVNYDPLLPSRPVPPLSSEMINLPFPKPIIYGDKQNLTNCVYMSNSPTESDRLFVPGAHNEAVIDAFSISSNDTVTLFQATIRVEHSVKAVRLDFLWDALVQHRPRPQQKW
jgi:hypothetical protein